MHMKMWRLNVGISHYGCRAVGIEGPREGRDLLGYQEGRLERIGGQHGGDLLEPELGPLELVGLAQDRGSVLGQFLELALDVAEVALEIFLDGAAVAVPLRPQIGARREPIVDAPEEVATQRNLHEQNVCSSTAVAFAGCRSRGVAFRHHLNPPKAKRSYRKARKAVYIASIVLSRMIGENRNMTVRGLVLALLINLILVLPTARALELARMPEAKRWEAGFARLGGGGGGAGHSTPWAHRTDK